MTLLNPEPGMLAPDFELINEDGRPVRLSDFRGRKLLLYAYAEDNTPLCTKQACDIRDAWKDFLEAGIQVVGISPDPPESHRAFIAKHGLPFSLLSDPEKKVMIPWGAWGMKNMYGRLVEGVKRSSFLIDEEGRFIRVWKRVTIPRHVADALKAVTGG